MNKLGIFVNFWEKKWAVDHRYYIEKVKSLGYDILEFQAQPLLEMSDGECRKIRKYAEERGIELSYSLGLNKKYDVASGDEEVRKGGVEYLKRIVEKIAVMEGELFSGVTFAGWGLPDHFVDEAEKRALFERSAESMREVMKTAEKAIRSFINDEPAGYKIYEMEHPDVLLWAVWALQQYAKETSREQCRQKYGELLKDIIEFIRQRKHENLFLHENGLLYANGTDKAITWMNSTVNGHPVIPRTGYIVEFNALWYNALRFVADLVREDGNVLLADALDAQAEVTGKSFIEVFRNEYGYLLDYVDGNMMDWSVRPNMIFAVAFDYSPLDRAQKKQVLDIATKELLTPKGLRTLSPKSGGYNPNYVGPQIQRDYAYHQGTAWPWLMGFYMEAYLRIYKMSGLSFIERQLIGLEDELTIHCISSLPELFDGNPPFKGRGAVSFAMNVAEVLRILKLLSKYY